MGTIGGVLVILVCLAAFAAMFGASKLAGRLVGWVVGLALVASVLSAFWSVVAGLLGQFLPQGPGGIGAVIVLALIGVAVVRFVNHRRRLEKWLGTRPTSQKRRVERE